MSPKVTTWSAQLATALQEASHLSAEEFAARLGIGARTVARWRQDPEVVPRPGIQRLLDEFLSTAATEVQERFHEAGQAPGQVGLHAALSVVINGSDVLLVRRRSDTAPQWQFPAGVVKPEATPEAVAVRETYSETGIDCAVRSTIGSRIHPITGVFCVYFLCDYLAGVPENRDPFENDSVRWAPRASIGNFVPLNRLFQPVRDLLLGGTP